MVRGRPRKTESNQTRYSKKSNTSNQGSSTSEILGVERPAIDVGIGCAPIGTEIAGNFIACTIPNIPILDIPNEEENFREPIEIEKTKASSMVISEMCITDGKNQIKIILNKQHNRMIKLQILLNGTEIKPTTFNGSTSAQGYWSLLKGLLK